MSAKLLLHTVLCMALAGVLVLHIRAGRRRPAVVALVVATLCVAAAPFLYKLWPGWLFPRMTLHWSQIGFVAATLAVFTPGAGRAVAAIEEPQFDDPRTGPMPLEDCVPPRNAPYH